MDIDRMETTRWISQRIDGTHLVYSSFVATSQHAAELPNSHALEMYELILSLSLSLSLLVLLLLLLLLDAVLFELFS